MSARFSRRLTPEIRRAWVAHLANNRAAAEAYVPDSDSHCLDEGTFTRLCAACRKEAKDAA